MEAAKIGHYLLIETMRKGGEALLIE